MQHCPFWQCPKQLHPERSSGSSKVAVRTQFISSSCMGTDPNYVESHCEVELWSSTYSSSPTRESLVRRRRCWLTACLSAVPNMFARHYHLNFQLEQAYDGRRAELQLPPTSECQSRQKKKRRSAWQKLQDFPEKSEPYWICTCRPRPPKH